MTRSIWRRTKQIKEGVARILVGKETRLAAFRHIGNAFDLTTEIQIGMPWGCQAFKVSFNETLAGSDCSPDRPKVPHLFLQWGRVTWIGRGFQAEKSGELRPEPLRAKGCRR